MNEQLDLTIGIESERYELFENPGYYFNFDRRDFIKAFGLGIVFIVPRLALLIDKNLPALLHVPSIFLSIVVAVFVGVVAGIYPAWRAAQLDPIEALRHE